jgi:hypothetical protein
MKKTFTKVLALFALSAVIITGCKKDDDNDGLSVTKENLTATYTLSSVKWKSSSTPEQDVTNQYVDACEKDDEMTFRSDSKVIIKDLGTQCSPSSTDSSTTWSVATGNKIVIDGDTSTVKSLTKSSLVLEQSEMYNGVTLTVTTSLNRK